MGMYDYGYEYGYDYGQGAAAAAGVAGFVVVFLVLYYLLMIGFAITTYVLQALSMHTIAKRRGIHHGWLAWVPVGNMWLLGSISDQYQYVAKGRVRNRRKVLMGLDIAMLALVFVLMIALVMMVVSEVAAYDAGEVLFGSSLAIMLLVYLAMLVLAVILVVFQYIALYDLFASCDPGNAVLYLVLSILLGVTLPFFMFACRKKDKGMPPRRTAQPAPELQEPPAGETQQPAGPVQEQAQACVQEAEQTSEMPEETGEAGKPVSQEEPELPDAPEDTQN